MTSRNLPTGPYVFFDNLYNSNYNSNSNNLLTKGKALALTAYDSIVSSVPQIKKYRNKLINQNLFNELNFRIFTRELGKESFPTRRKTIDERIAILNEPILRDILRNRVRGASLRRQLYKSGRVIPTGIIQEILNINGVHPILVNYVINSRKNWFVDAIQRLNLNNDNMTLRLLNKVNKKSVVENVAFSNLRENVKVRFFRNANIQPSTLLKKVLKSKLFNKQKLKFVRLAIRVEGIPKIKHVLKTHNLLSFMFKPILNSNLPINQKLNFVKNEMKSNSTKTMKTLKNQKLLNRNLENSISLEPANVVTMHDMFVDNGGKVKFKMGWTNTSLKHFLKLHGGSSVLHPTTGLYVNRRYYNPNQRIRFPAPNKKNTIG